MGKLFKNEMAKTKTSKRSAPKHNKSGDKKKVAMQTKAGLKFPVGRLKRYLRLHKLSNVNRVGASAAVFMAATLEYPTAEIMEPSGDRCKEDKRQRVKPRHILLSVKADEELSKIMSGQFPREAGMEPKDIHPELLPKKKGKKVQNE